LEKLLTLIAFSVLLLVPLGATNAYAHDATGDQSCGTLTGGGLDPTTAHTLTINPPAPMAGDDVTVTSERTGGSTITLFTRNITIFKDNVQQAFIEEIGVVLPYTLSTIINDITPGAWVICAGHNEDNIDRIHFDKIVFTVLQPPAPIGGTLIPIDTTALLLAGVQSISMWMIPVVVAGIVIGVFVIKRRK